MNRTAIALAALLASPNIAAAQQATYTNIIDGQRTDNIVKVVRETGPAAPVPPSITTTEVLPRNWRPPLGPSFYVPLPAPAATVSRSYRRPVRQRPWSVTAVGRPIIDVNIVGRTR